MKPIFQLTNVSLQYRSQVILRDVSFSVMPQQVTCLVGPSGSGKSTLLRTLNRLNDAIPSFRCLGEVLYHGQDIYSGKVDVSRLRQEVGMVFQKPCIYPRSIFANVIFGVNHLKTASKHEYPAIVERCLKQACLWDEVHERLQHPATELSLGQQQRLTIARALTMKPQVLLLDEPTSSLDPKARDAIEALISQLKAHLCIVLVSHNAEQVARVGDQVVEMERFQANRGLTHTRSAQVVVK